MTEEQRTSTIKAPSAMVSADSAAKRSGMEYAGIFTMLCAIGAFAILSSTMSKSPVLPLFASSLGASSVEIGLIASASTLPGVLVSLPAGALSDRLGKKKLLLASAVLFATAPLFYLFVRTPLELALVRFYHGFATAVFGPVAMGMIGERFSKDKGEKMGLYSTFTMLGRFAAPMLGGAIIFAVGFAGVFLVCALSGGIALLLSSFVLALDKNAEEITKDGVPLSERVRAIASRGVLVTSAVEAVQYFCIGSVEVFLPLYALSCGMPEWLIGILLGIQVVATFFSKPIMGRMSDKSGRERMIVSGLAVCACAVVPMGMLGGLAGGLLLAIPVVTFGIGVATVTASTSALVSDLAPKNAQGSAMGLISTIMDVGQMAGPIVTGVLVLRLGFASSFMLLGLALASAVPAFILGRAKIARA